MVDIQKILNDSCPIESGIFRCISEATLQNEIKKVEIETYTHRADEFDEAKMLRLPQAEYRSLEPIRHIPKDSIILELGCGDGRFGFQLMREGYTVIESDIAIGSVKKVKETAEKNNLDGGTYATIDAEHLPFIDGSIGAILMVATFHHLPEPARALQEMKRVLKPGGLVVLLREPATWQYTVFGPLYRLLRKMLRRRNHNHISHADDATHGFSMVKFRNLITPLFGDMKLIPVQYLEKCYLNYVILKNKFRKTNTPPLEFFCRFLQAIDAVIAKIPVIKNYPWDWDIIARKY